MNVTEARTLATIVKTSPHRSTFAPDLEPVLGAMSGAGLIEIDERLHLHANRDAALQALSSFVLHNAIR